MTVIVTHGVCNGVINLCQRTLCIYSRSYVHFIRHVDLILYYIPELCSKQRAIVLDADTRD